MQTMNPTTQQGLAGPVAGAARQRVLSMEEDYLRVLLENGDAEFRAAVRKRLAEVGRLQRGRRGAKVPAAAATAMV